MMIKVGPVSSRIRHGPTRQTGRSCSQIEMRSSRGAVELGMQLTARGGLQGAKEAYQKAIDSRHGHASPLAAVKLGMLLRETCK
jgi:hypothetical protein